MFTRGVAGRALIAQVALFDSDSNPLQLQFTQPSDFQYKGVQTGSAVRGGTKKSPSIIN